MRKLFIALSIALAAVFTSSCDYDVNVSVDASAELLNTDLSILTTETVRFGPYHNYTLTDSELESIFSHLTQNIDASYTDAFLYLVYFDNITGETLREETYSARYSSSRKRMEFNLIEL